MENLSTSKLAERKPFILKEGERMSLATPEIREYINSNINEDPKETELLFIELKKTLTDSFRDEMEEREEKIDENDTHSLTSVTNDMQVESLNRLDNFLNSGIDKLKSLIQESYKEKFNKELTVQL